MPRTVFRRTRWAVGIAILFALASMFRYPGGTPLDRLTDGYSLSHNFLSDLGMTVAYDGHANQLGALLFVVSLIVLVIGLAGCLFGFVRRYSESSRSRAWARAAGGGGILGSLAFVGVALTPENRVMAIHVSLTVWAWRIVFGASFLLAVASQVSHVFPRQVTIAWDTLTIILLTYVLFLQWGPSPSSYDGLPAQVIAQKLVAVIVIGGLTYLSVQADRVAT